MKIRNGFVSNSSSSSYTCDICGGTESGWDLCLNEAEMTECEDGHVFCDRHMQDIKELTLEEKQEQVLKWFKDTGEDDEEMVEGVESGDEDWIEDSFSNMMEESDSRYSWPCEQCPCCQLTAVTDQDLITYLLNCYGQTRKEVEREMKEKYGTLSDMNADMNSELTDED